MAISAKDVMELRKQTDCGMMECKKALTQADGDFEKAIEILREQGLAAANKKAGRSTPRPTSLPRTTSLLTSPRTWPRSLLTRTPPMWRP